MKKIKLTFKEAKEDYRTKLEWKLQQNSTSKVWKGMRTITGFSSTGNRGVKGSVDWANELNLFFNRFDNVGPATPSDVYFNNAEVFSLSTLIPACL